MRSIYDQSIQQACDTSPDGGMEERRTELKEARRYVSDEGYKGSAAGLAAGG